MNGAADAIFAYALGLVLMLGYAALVWNARRRAAGRSAPVSMQRSSKPSDE